MILERSMPSKPEDDESEPELEPLDEPNETEPDEPEPEPEDSPEISLEPEPEPEEPEELEPKLQPDEPPVAAEPPLIVVPVDQVVPHDVEKVVPDGVIAA
ncbi:unnamed protein product [Ambrosiozyma monospora]|uniref:Unnamed protein product n=1 Tax=Ambrosiozyma monospora TaxID=43982 RepID=A0ACB5UAU3_AMBMO|nr:unnamed protein product [Ambrosiozyma monospora]